MSAWKIAAKKYRERLKSCETALAYAYADMRVLEARLAQTPIEQQEVAESAWLAGMSGTWHDRYINAEADVTALRAVIHEVKGLSEMYITCAPGECRDCDLLRRIAAVSGRIS